MKVYIYAALLVCWIVLTAIYVINIGRTATVEEKMAKPQTTKCWYKEWRPPHTDQWIKAEFHEWGMAPDSVSMDAISVGILEVDKTGTIVMVDPERIRFRDPT